MKRALLVIVAFIVVLVGAAALLPGFVDLNLYKDHALNEIRARTGLELKVDGNVSLALLPSPRFTVDKVSMFDPNGQAREPLASFERLDVRVDLFPLLSGDVSVSSLTLVKPEINVNIQEDGRISGYTETLSNLSSSDGAEAAKDGSGNGLVPSVSLADVRIKDGTFHYTDRKSGSKNTVSNINLDLSMPHLGGAIKAQGSLFSGGKAVNFQTDIGAYSSEDQAISLDLHMNIEPEGVSVKYNGIVSLDGDVSAQGKLDVSLEDVSKGLSHYGQANIFQDNVSLQLSGLLSANAKSVQCASCVLSVGTGKFLIGINADLLNSSAVLDIDTASKLSFDEVFSLSVPFDDISLKTKVNAQKDNGVFGGEGSFIQLGEHKVNFDGAYDVKSAQRPYIQLSVNAPILNIDRLLSDETVSSGSKGASAPTLQEGVKGTLSSLVLPFDLDLTAKVKEIIWQKNKVKNVYFDTVLKSDNLNIKAISVDDFAGSSAKLSAQIKNLNKKNIEMTSYIEAQISDVQKTMDVIGVSSDGIPDALDNMTIKTKMAGRFEVLNLTANIDALGADILLKGTLNNVLEKGSMKGMELQVKHKNMARFLKDVADVSIDGKHYSKPMDFYTKFDHEHNTYTFNGMKGDFSGISVTGDTKVKLSSSSPSIEGNLSFGNLIIPSAMAAKGGGTGAKKGAVRERWSKQALDVSALHAVNLDLSLKAKKIQYGVWPLSNVSTEFKLHNGEVRIDNLKAGVFGGSMSLDASVKTQKKERQPIYFQSYSAFKNVDLGKLSKTLIGKQVVDVTGRGTLDLTLKSSGASQAALIHDLNGNGSVSGKELVLRGVDVTRFAKAMSEDTKLSDSLTGLWKGTTKGGQTNFDVLDGAFRIERGQVHISKMDLDGPEAFIQTTGVINLPQWTLNTKHKISVKGEEDAVEPFEMSFSGSLDNPSQTFGQGLLNDYLNRKVQRKFNKILSDRLGGKANDNKNQEQDSAPQKNVKEQEPATIEDVAEEAIKNVIGDLFR